MELRHKLVSTGKFKPYIQIEFKLEAREYWCSMTLGALVLLLNHANVSPDKAMINAWLDPRDNDFVNYCLQNKLIEQTPNDGFKIKPLTNPKSHVRLDYE